jgi:dipeptidyl aminopeptidase/acylaminoacyl peptidase
LPLRSDLFLYDRNVPLRFSVEGEHTSVADVRYDNGEGGAVNALVVRPPDLTGNRSGVIVAHGGFEGGKHLFLEQAIELSQSGFTVLVADTAFPRDGDAAGVEAAVRSGVLTHRRGLDVLESVYDAGRLGFFGHSRGGLEGAILAAVEPRLRAVAIGGMGSPSQERRKRGHEEVEMRSYFDALFSFDAALYLRASEGRRLLVQHGRDDAEVTLAEARAMFETAGEPKIWREYDCGHGVDGHPAARTDRIAFFRDALDEV